MTTLNKALVQLGFDQNNDYVLGADENGNESIWQWHSELPQPTQEAIDQAKIDWEAEWNATQYQRDRKQAYASIEEQLDMQYWDSVNGTTTWADHIAAVKGAHPKP